MNGVTITPANLSLRKFCGCCGTRFEEGQLLPIFKYCMHCGKELAPWLINVISTGIPPVTPPATPTTNRQIDQSQTDQEITDQEMTDQEMTNQEMEDVNINESGGSIVTPVRGRGESRTRGGRHRGGRGRGLEPSTPSPLAEQNRTFGRGMRSVPRLDYSVPRYFQNTLYGKSKKHKAKSAARNHPILSLTDQSHENRRHDLGVPASPTEVISYFKCC